jgi:hypothetical protein
MTSDAAFRRLFKPICRTAQMSTLSSVQDRTTSTMDSVQYEHVSASSQKVVSRSEDLSGVFLALPSKPSTPTAMQTPHGSRGRRCDEAPHPPKHLLSFSGALLPPQRRNSFTPFDTLSDSMSKTRDDYETTSERCHTPKRQHPALLKDLRTSQLDAVAASNAALSSSQWKSSQSNTIAEAATENLPMEMSGELHLPTSPSPGRNPFTIPYDRASSMDFTLNASEACSIGCRTPKRTPSSDNTHVAALTSDQAVDVLEIRERRSSIGVTSRKSVKPKAERLSKPKRISVPKEITLQAMSSVSPLSSPRTKAAGDSRWLPAPGGSSTTNSRVSIRTQETSSRRQSVGSSQENFERSSRASSIAAHRTIRRQCDAPGNASSSVSKESTSSLLSYHWSIGNRSCKSSSQHQHTASSNATASLAGMRAASNLSRWSSAGKSTLGSSSESEWDDDLEATWVFELLPQAIDRRKSICVQGQAHNAAGDQSMPRRYTMTYDFSSKESKIERMMDTYTLAFDSTSDGRSLPHRERYGRTVKNVGTAPEKSGSRRSPSASKHGRMQLARTKSWTDGFVSVASGSAEARSSLRELHYTDKHSAHRPRCSMPTSSLIHAMQGLAIASSPNVKLDGATHASCATDIVPLKSAAHEQVSSKNTGSVSRTIN